MKSQSTDSTKQPVPKGVYTELRKGLKKCPIGDHYIAARAFRCPICGDLPTKRVDLDKAKKIVRDMGGVKQVKAQIQSAESALGALKRLGGLEGAKEIVVNLEANLEELEALMK